MIFADLVEAVRRLAEAGDKPVDVRSPSQISADKRAAEREAEKLRNKKPFVPTPLYKRDIKPSTKK